MARALHDAAIHVGQRVVDDERRAVVRPHDRLDAAHFEARDHAVEHFLFVAAQAAVAPVFNTN